MIKPFVVDEANCSDTDFVLDLPGLGSINVERNSDGVLVDVYPLHIVDEPLQSIWLDNGDFAVPEDAEFIKHE